MSPLPSRAIPGGPEWFFFADTEIPTFLGPWASFFASSLFGLPGVAQNTHDFCRLPPPTDLPTPDDWAFIGDPIHETLSGAYGRMGNLIRAHKWQALCEYTVPEPSPDFAGLPDGYEFYYRNEQTTSPATNMLVFWVSDPLPVGGDSIAGRMVGGGADPHSMTAVIVTDRPNVGDSYVDLYNAGRTGHQFTFNQSGAPPAWAATTVTSPLAANHYVALFASFNSHQVDSFTFDLAVHYSDPPPLPVLPVAPDVPNYPTSGGPCDAPTLSDLCKSIAGVQDTANLILRSINPPVVVVDPHEDPVVPVDGPPPADGSPPPLAPVLKPPMAIGAVVHITAMPGYVAKYGTSPAFYPDLGHVAQLTDYGPLPSVLIKHNPLVILPLQATVSALALDLEPGVEAAISWIYPPVDAPAPV
jgi:hypothetical protein